ncbi:MAG: glutathione S-transferase family protein [Novosphingobium sp.]|nr:glutathione S-transferase family protein [Novosphingobium sp.]MBO9600942.1 glutathione S-transferase family protein [Novosphingobium sp.]
MILYGFPLSPFVRKVLIAIKEKGIEARMVPSNPNQPDEAFLRASPFRKIPAIEDGDFRLADSTAIVAYLDAKFPEPALIPAEPEARGRAVWFEEVVDTILIPAGAPIVVNRFLKPVIFKTEGDEEAARAGEEAILKPLDYLESVLSTGGWLAGDYSVGDLSLASSAKTLGYAGWTIDADRHPSLANWYARVCDRPAWQLAAEQEAAVFASLGG